MVYLRFVTHNLTVEQGFQIVYREHLSPNSAPTQLSSPSKTEFQTPLMPSANDTFFSAVLHQLDSLIAGNLLTANQLKYVQTHLNDRLEEFSYQLGTHVQIIANTSCTSVNHSFTAYAPLFLTTNMLCFLYPLYLSFFPPFSSFLPVVFHGDYITFISSSTKTDPKLLLEKHQHIDLENMHVQCNTV